MRFQVQAGGKTYEVEAPDQAAALKALQPLMQKAASGPDFSEANPAPSNPAVDAAAAAKGQQIQNQDMLDAAGSGLVSGGIGLAGLGGDIASTVGSIGAWGARQLGASPEDQAATAKFLRRGIPIIGQMPSSEDINGLIGRTPYQPKTGAGKVIGTIAEFAPGAVTMGAGSAAKAGTSLARKALDAGGDLIKYAVIPGAASEGAGALTKGTALEPFARGAAAIAAGGLAGAKKGIKGLAPTTDDIEAASNALRDQANSINLVIKPQTYDGIAADVANVAKNAGVDKGVSPTAYAAMQRVLDERPAVQGINSSPMTLEKMDTIRKVLGAASREKGPDFKPTPSAAIATQMLQRFDQRMNLLGHADVLSGNPQTANALMGQSRELWRRKIKADIIERAIENGQNAKSGPQNGIQNEFIRLLKSGKYNWTPAERAAIKKVASGGGIAGHLLNLLGAFGISTDQGRNMIGALAGTLTGGLPLTIAGTAARVASRRLSSNLAESAAGVARAGGQPMNRTFRQPLSTPRLPLSFIYGHDAFDASHRSSK